MMLADPTRIDVSTDPLTRVMSGVTMHGLIPFSVPFISEIAPDLWQGGCKDGLVLPRHICHAVSLYPWESYTLRHELATSVTVRMTDGLEEDLCLIADLARWVNACRKSGPVLVNCQAGLNRSSLVVASALMAEGMAAGDAIALIREKRSPACLCNPAFEAWLRSAEPRRRAECPACGRLMLLNLSGRLRAHQAGPRQRHCPLSGSFPGDEREQAAS
jgi:protein-tyrosine phosphatase